MVNVQYNNCISFFISRTVLIHVIKQCVVTGSVMSFTTYCYRQVLGGIDDFVPQYTP